MGNILMLCTPTFLLPNHILEKKQGGENQKWTENLLCVLNGGLRVWSSGEEQQR